MTDNLILDSLEIRNFRAFKHLQIERLARVNLIVGRNNIGKTCLLEALWLYANRGDPEVMLQILAKRDEASVDENIKHLIYGYSSNGTEICIGENNPQDRLIISRTNKTAWSASFDNRAYFAFEARELAASQTNPTDVPKIPLWFVPTDGVKKSDVFEMWNTIQLTDFENEVTNVLSIIEPNLQRVAINLEQHPIAKLKNFDKPVLLSSLGEGMNRMFGLALVMVNAKNGMVLIDEIENGLYYDVQPQVWQFIFEAAERFNTQLFVTTHSWDTIEAFEEILSERSQDDGILVSLWPVVDRPGEVVGVISDKETLAIVTKAKIEVR